MCISNPRMSVPPPPPPAPTPPPMPVAPPAPPPANKTAPERAASASRTNTDDMVAQRTGSPLSLRRRRGKAGLKVSQAGGVNYPGY